MAMGGELQGERPGGRMPPRKTCAGITEEVEDKHIQAANVRELLHMEPHAPLPRKPKTKLSWDYSGVQVLFSRHRPIQRLVSQTGLYWERVGSILTSDSFPV